MKKKKSAVFLAALSALVLTVTDFSSAAQAFGGTYASTEDLQTEDISSEEDTEAGTEDESATEPKDEPESTEGETEDETQTDFPDSGEAAIDQVEVSYDLERQKLSVSWFGRNIAAVDIYQDGEQIADKIVGDIFTMKIALQAGGEYTYKIVSFNEEMEEGEIKTLDLSVGNYVARIESLEAEYDESKRQICLEWTSAHTEYVDIYLNGEAVVTEYKKNAYVINYALQPGADYQVSVLPHNSKREMGAGREERLSVGEFEVPETPDLQRISIDIKDSNGNYTGFCRPAIEVKWEAQANACYEIYRAKDDRQSSYVWIANVKANADGEYTYTDKSIVPGDYYYKVRRKIEEDTYTFQELFSSLSDSEWIDASVPRATVRTALSEDGGVLLTLGASRDYVSGYEIYRKVTGGNYKKIGEVTGNTYEDTNVTFGIMYYYKVRAYYYDSKSRKKMYGSYSMTSRARNTVGPVKAQVKAVSSDKVKLTWSKVSNAKRYEVYCKSALPGDSYELIKETDKLSITKQLKTGRKYTFLIKAYGTDRKGNTYFSSAEITFRTGFSTPKDFAVSKTTYDWDQAAKKLTQHDRLTWSRVYGADGYYIERYNKDTGGYDTVMRIKKGSITGYTVSNPVTADESAIVYRVGAYLGGKILYGDTVSVTPKLGTVKNVRVRSQKSKITVSWQQVAAAERYAVYRSNGRTMVQVGETDGLSFVDQGLDVGAPYTYYVRAVNSSCGYLGDYSEPVAFLLLPQTVTKVSGVSANTQKAVLKWRAVTKAKYYIVYYAKEKGGEYKKLATVRGGEKYTHKNLEKGTVYYYKVTAVQKNRLKMKVESLGSTPVRVKIVK